MENKINDIDLDNVDLSALDENVRDDFRTKMKQLQDQISFLQDESIKLQEAINDLNLKTSPDKPEENV